MKMKKFIALLLSFAMLLSLPALAVNVSGQNTASDGQVSSIITMDAEPAQMTVTVPAALPVSVSADGTVTVASDAKVSNLSPGPVCVTDIRAEAVDPWTLVGSDYSFASAKVNSKVLQVSVQGQVAGEDGQIPMPDGDWSIGGKSDYPFTYGAKIPAQELGFTGNLASIVFTVDWDKVDTPLTGLVITGPDTVVKGSTIALTATKQPSYTTNMDPIVWSTSNANVATVDNNGIVTGVGAGTVTITASCGGKAVGHTVVTTVPLSGLSISGASTVNKGNSITLTATKNPPDATGPDTITWSSSNTSVATVSSSGAVTGVRVGSVTITARCGDKSATHAVSVKSPLKSIGINGNGSVYVGNTISLSITKNPTDATDTGSVTWSSSNTSVATVSSAGVVRGVSAGTVTITASCGGKTATKSVTVQVASPATISGVRLSLSCSDGFSNTAPASNDGSGYYTANYTFNPSVSHRHDHDIIVEIPQQDGWRVSSVQVNVSAGGTSRQIDYTSNDAEKYYMTMYYGMNWPIIDAETFTAQVSFTLTKSDDVYLRGLTISGNSSITKGGTTQLTATKSPSNTTDTSAIAWSSSNTSVATVNGSGVVTGVKEGTATITASCNGKTATKEVTVAPATLSYYQICDPATGRAPTVNQWGIEHDKAILTGTVELRAFYSDGSSRIAEGNIEWKICSFYPITLPSIPNDSLLEGIETQGGSCSGATANFPNLYYNHSSASIIAYVNGTAVDFIEYITNGQ